MLVAEKVRLKWVSSKKISIFIINYSNVIFAWAINVKLTWMYRICSYF